MAKLVAYTLAWFYVKFDTAFYICSYQISTCWPLHSHVGDISDSVFHLLVFGNYISESQENVDLHIGQYFYFKYTIQIGILVYILEIFLFRQLTKAFIQFSFWFNKKAVRIYTVYIYIGIYRHTVENTVLGTVQTCTVHLQYIIE